LSKHINSEHITGEPVMTDNIKAKDLQQKIDALPEIMTAEQMADLLNVTPQVVCQLAREKKLPGREIGGQWRFARFTLQLLIAGLYEPSEADKAALESVQRLVELGNSFRGEGAAALAAAD
jgi:excisionase family DNA binding protein